MALTAEQAKCFYEKFGFIVLPDSKKMFIAMHTIKELFLRES